MDRSITLELPFPPTVNRYWQVARNRLIKTKRARDYRKIVSLYLLASHESIREWNTRYDVEGNRIVKDERTLALAVAVHYPVKAGPDGDIDNLLKVMIDCLEGTLFENDKQFRHVQISKETQDKKEGSVRVTIRECPNELELYDKTFEVLGVHV